jgi:hypothetical protein
MEMRSVKLPSGRELRLHAAPFADARELYQAMLEEAKSLKIDAQAEVDVNMFKDLFCAALSSKRIESALWKCMARAIYNGAKVTPEVFEPVEARQDYFDVLFEVTKENILPFTKSLSARFAPMLESVKNSLALKSPTTQG